jgi:S-(hydroxymethyl)glutathione dehydrogenase / alcohol dehydrogenase
MRAAVYVEQDQPLIIEEMTPLDPGPGDVVVDIGASGVCHSDLSATNGTLPLPPPTILGHEGVGTVDWVGSEVSQVKKGDRVIGTFIPSCGACWYCTHDQSNLCEQTGPVMMTPRAQRPDGTPIPGFTGLGTFADSMTISEAQAVKVETDLPDDQLALLGCGVTTGVGAALNTAQVTPGSSVAVIGCGGVGQSVIQGARIAGAAKIIAVDPVEMKRETARKFGATDTVDPAKGDPVARVQALTGGRGADFAFEVIGLPETITQAFSSARRGGTAVVVGMPRMDSMVTLPGFAMFYEEKRLLGCVYGSAQVRRDFPRFIDLVEHGRLDLGSMVSRHIKLDEVNDAFTAMKAGEVIRSVIV